MISELEKKGFHIFPEAATSIIECEKINGRCVSDIVTDPNFQDEIHELKLRQFIRSRDYNGAVFFDTTFIDDIAHRRVTGVEIESIQSCVMTRRYDIMFFLEHPGTVEANGIRLEDSTQALELDRLKREALAEFMYNPVVVPFIKMGDLTESIERRVGIILGHLQSYNAQCL